MRHWPPAESKRKSTQRVLCFSAVNNRRRVAVRPSGTEPKIKYYLFAHRRPEKGKFDSVELNQIKTEVKEKLDRLWDWLQEDATSRLAT